MTIYDQGDVLLVPFPFTDHSTTKLRPAVVLSGHAYNAVHPDVILAPITGHAAPAADEVDVTGWKTAGLLKPSTVKPILSSFDTRLIVRQLGALSAADRAQMRATFARILDLP